MMPFAPIYDVYQLIRNFGMQLLWEKKNIEPDVRWGHCTPQLS
jgi:hypothetical protein